MPLNPEKILYNNYAKHFQWLLLLGSIMLFSGCEGFKVLTLHNFSHSQVRLTVKPGINDMEKYQISNYPSSANKIGDSMSLTLPRDSSIVLTSTFTSFMAGPKLKEQDIKIDYLKIETDDSTFVADSKKEILNLIRDESFRYHRKTDKNRAILNSRNFGNIIIRE